MRRRLAVLAAVPLLFAAACGSGSAETPKVNGAESVQVKGDTGAKPEAAFPTGAPAKVSAYQVLNPGTGPAFAQGDIVETHYTVWDWDGKENKERISSYTANATTPIKINEQLPKVLLEGFTKTKGGGRFMAVVAPDSMTKEQAEQVKAAGEDPNKTQVFVMDPVKELATAAAGKETGEKVEGVKVVNPGGDKAPTLTTKTDAKPPTELISKVLITGTGTKVRETDTVIAHYVGKIWGTDKQFDSSWDRGQTAEFSLDGVIPGWKQGLKDVPAGSRVLLVIPPALGYGDQEQNGIPAKSTLVFVVDVLYGG